MIGIGYVVLIAVGTFIIGFIVSAGFSLWKMNALESALAWLLCVPDSAEARANAQEVLKE
jgi:hypothetical protein